MNIGRLINRLPDIVEKLRAATDEFAVIKRVSGGDYSITSRLIRQESKAEAVFSLADNHLVYKFEDSEFMSTWGGAAAFRELEKLSVAIKKPILIHGAQTPGPFARRGSVQRAAPGSQSFYYTPPSNPRNVDANLFLQAYGAGTVHTSHFDALSELQLRRNRFVPISELKDKLIYRNMSSQRGAEKSLIAFGGTDEKPLLNFINYRSGPRHQERKTLEIDYIQSQEYGMGHRLFNEVARRAFRLDRDIYSLELLSNAGKRSSSSKDQPSRKTKSIPEDAAPGPDLVMSVFPQLRYRLRAGYTASTAKTRPFRGRTFEANSVHEIVKKLSGLGRDDLRYTLIEDVYTPVTGMPKGGMNDQLRKFVNPAVLLAGVGAGLYSADKGFGSPWRGIISVSREFLSLLDNDIPRGAVLRKVQLDSFNLLGSVKEGTALHAEVTDVLKKANIFYENTNDIYEKLILVRKDLPLSEVKEVIRHERSHQVFSAMADHSREYAAKKMLGRPTKSSIRNALIQTFRRIGYTWPELNADSYIVTHKMLFPGKEHIAATDEIMATLIGAKKANFESFRRITGKSETADELVELTRYIKGKGRSYLNAHLKEVRAKYFANAVEGMPEQGANKEMRLLINPEAQGLGPDRGSGSAWRKLFAGKGLAEAFRTALKELNLTVHVDRWLEGARYTQVTNSIFIPPDGTPFSRIFTLFHEIAEAHHDSRLFKGLPQKLGKRLAKLSRHPEVLRRKRRIAVYAYPPMDDLDFVDAVRDSVLTRLTNKLLRENEKPLKLRAYFAGHASSAVIADEALFARSISKAHFLKIRAFRLDELSRRIGGRSLEELTESDAEYIRRTKQIYRNVEKKWPLIAKKFGLPENNVEPYPLASYLQTEPRVQGMQEYGQNKSLRDVIKPSVMMLGIAGGLYGTDRGFGSAWRKLFAGKGFTEAFYEAIRLLDVFYVKAAGATSKYNQRTHTITINSNDVDIAVSQVHEISEAYHMARQTKNLPMRIQNAEKELRYMEFDRTDDNLFITEIAKKKEEINQLKALFETELSTGAPSRSYFITHVSTAVVADTALFAKTLGDDVFRRVWDLDISSRRLKRQRVLDYKNRPNLKANVIELLDYDLEVLDSQISHLNTIYTNIDKKWHLLSKKFLPVKGMPEEGAAKDMRHMINPAAQGFGIDKGSGSSWQGIESNPNDISEDMSKNELDLVDPYAYIDYTPGKYGDLRNSEEFAAALKKLGISDPESVFGVRLGSTTAILPEEEIYDAMAHPGGGNYTSDYVKGTMEIGNKIHRYAQAQLAEQQLLKYAEKKALIGTSGIYGFLDAVDIAEGIWEFKSISNSVLQTLSEPYPSHVKQLQLYMHAAGQTSGVIEYIARDDLSFRKRFVVSYDEKIAQSTINTVALAREHLLNDLKSGALSKSDVVRKNYEEFYNTAPEYVSPADLDLEDARKDYYRYLESFNQLKRPVPGNLDEIIAARTQYNMTTPRGQGYDIIAPKYTSQEYVRASAAEKSRIVGEDNYETLQNEVNYVKQKRQKQMKDNPMYYANQMVDSNNGYSMLSSTTPKRGY